MTDQEAPSSVEARTRGALKAAMPVVEKVLQEWIPTRSWGIQQPDCIHIDLFPGKDVPGLNDNVLLEAFKGINGMDQIRAVINEAYTDPGKLEIVGITGPFFEQSIMRTAKIVLVLHRVDE